MQLKEFSVDRAIRPSDEWTSPPIAHAVTCPRCDNDYALSDNVRTVSSDDNYAASWSGRGDLTIIHFKGECGHEWELCFGFHKGKTYAYCRTLAE